MFFLNKIPFNFGLFPKPVLTFAPEMSRGGKV